MNLELLQTKLKEIGIPVEYFIEKAHRVYLVGGAIRDALLGREIIDFDFAVEGSGLEYAKSFAHKLGATFVPLKLDEGRVVYKKRWILDFSGLGTNGIEEDLTKRDFTINAMAIELGDLIEKRWRLIDPMYGLKDLKSKRIRMTTRESVIQDPLRILRAFRFASQLDFRIEEETRRTLRIHKKLLSRVAAERISYELFLILQVDTSWGCLNEMGELSILFVLLPELKKMDKLLPEIKLWAHSIHSLKELEEILLDPGRTFAELEPYLKLYFGWKKRKPLLKLATLFHDIGKPSTISSDDDGKIHFYGHDTLGETLLVPILKDRLRLSRREIGTVTHLVKYHMRPHLLGREEEPTPRAMRRFFIDLGEEWVGVLLLAYADALATENGDVSKLKRLISRLVRFKEEEEKKGEVERLINGHDLIEEFKLQPGPIFRKILERVEEEQLDGRITTREEALEFVRKMLKERGEG